MKRIRRLAACLAAAVLALVLTASVERLIAVWAAGLVRGAPPHVKRAAARRLERLGTSGIEALLDLARDRTVVALEGSPPLAPGLIPHDTVGDFALDALRRLRTGNPEAPRLFEWNVGSGVSHEEAQEAYRAEELGRAEAWWRSAKKKATP